MSEPTTSRERKSKRIMRRKWIIYSKRIQRFENFLWGPKGEPKDLDMTPISVYAPGSKWEKYTAEFQFEETSSSINNMFMRDLCEGIKTKDFTDGHIVINGVEIPCHMLLLRAFISMFREKKYAGNKIVLQNSPINAENFELFYDWMTNAKTEFTASEVISLYGTAKVFQISSLENYCLECISGDEQFRKITSFNCFSLACRPHTLSLAETLLARVSFYFLAIVSTVEFTQLNVSQVMPIIATPNLTVQSEIEVFYAIVLWVSVKLDERKTYVDQIMRYVKFEFLPPLFLMKLMMSDVEKIVMNCATSFVLQRAEAGLRCQLENSYPQMGELISWSPTRFWIIDLHCPYVEKLETGDVTVSFKDFLSYLKKIHEVSAKNTKDGFGESFQFDYNEEGTDLTEESDNVPAIEINTEAEPTEGKDGKHSENLIVL